MILKLKILLLSNLFIDYCFRKTKFKRNHIQRASQQNPSVFFNFNLLKLIIINSCFQKIQQLNDVLPILTESLDYMERHDYMQALSAIKLATILIICLLLIIYCF